MSEEEYQGYKNKETWSVHQWWTSDSPGMYEHWYNRAKEYVLHVNTRQQVIDGIWTEQQAAKYLLADEMKDSLKEGQTIWVNSEKASLLSDLLTTALGRVDWYEVAESFLQTVREDWGPEGCNDAAVKACGFNDMGEAAEAQELIEREGEPPLCPSCHKAYVTENSFCTLCSVWYPSKSQITEEDCEACEAVTEANEPPLEYDQDGKAIGYSPQQRRERLLKNIRKG